MSDENNTFENNGQVQPPESGQPGQYGGGTQEMVSQINITAKHSSPRIGRNRFQTLCINSLMEVRTSIPRRLAMPIRHSSRIAKAQCLQRAEGLALRL